MIYFAGYKRTIDHYKVSKIERVAGAIVWCRDEAPGFTAAREQDRAVVGNIVAALDAYGSRSLREPPIRLDAVDLVIAFGSDPLMAAVAQARHDILASHLRRGHHAIGSIKPAM